MKKILIAILVIVSTSIIIYLGAQKYNRYTSSMQYYVMKDMSNIYGKTFVPYNYESMRVLLKVLDSYTTVEYDKINIDSLYTKTQNFNYVNTKCINQVLNYIENL